MKAPRSWPRSAAVVLLSAVVCGCGKPGPQDRAQLPREELEFEQLFGQHCAACHGKDGRQGPAPPLNDPIFRAIVDARTVVSVISEGRPGTLMPAFGAAARGRVRSDDEGRATVHPGRESLSDRQVEILASGILSWGPVYKPTGPAPPPYQAPKGSAADVQAGRKVFASTCARCHGKDGRGAKAGALHDPVFLALISNQALRRIIITGREDFKMPDYASVADVTRASGPLTDRDVTNLVALLASWRTEP